MSDNQYVFEVIRDIGYAIQNMNHDKILAVTVVKDEGQYFSWRTSQGNPCGKGETARAIEKAYKVTRGYPDEREVRIKELEEAIKTFRDNPVTANMHDLFEMVDK